MLTPLFLSGFVRLHVLDHAAREPVFGVELMNELRRHGYRLPASRGRSRVLQRGTVPFAESRSMRRLL